MNLVIAVIATWALLTGWVMLLGAFAGSLVRPTLGAFASLRVAMWSGLGILSAFLLIANLFVPMLGATALLLALILTIAAVLAWLLIVRRRGPIEPGQPIAHSWAGSWWILVPIIALALMIILVAHAFAGPITNYDSGVYHLNAIQFSANYPTIVGLANMQDRLGTNVSTFNLAAFMANSPWGIEAFRMLVGFIAFLFATDTSIRLLEWRNSRKSSPGTFVMLLAASLCFPVLIGNPGYWVTSPTADSISMFLTVVAAAYLVDGVVQREARSTWAALTLLVAVIAASVRTQLWVFAFLTALVLLVQWKLSKAERRLAPLTWITSGLSLIIFVTMMVRDVIISGWLLFPAGLAPMPVSWRVPDPSGPRMWLLSWARKPGGDPATVLSNWDWFLPWLQATLNDWAVRGAIGMLTLFIILVLAVPKFDPNKVDPTGLALSMRYHGLPSKVTWLLVMVPVVGTVFVWFWAAPDPRFAWGAIALLGIIPAALALSALDSGFTNGVVAFPRSVILMVVTGFTCATLLPSALAGIGQIKGYVDTDWELREYAFGPITIAADVNPVLTANVAEYTLSSGQKVVVPVNSDQCWMTFPLCRPYADPTMVFRGKSVADGMIRLK